MQERRLSDADGREGNPCYIRRIILPTGAQLGVFEILGLLGRGGMGEVYRARDTSLQRDVAIKVLPEAFTNHPTRLARLRTEARVLASLNHPNIAHIHGLEGNALVMELVVGADLSALIARGPMPLGEALAVARQIADALEAAHDLGIVHRDLKPANIKVRPDGVVKVLDFGLAKAMDATEASGSDASTLTVMETTEAGVILGTAAYMSPEQARGQVVDRRADIWAFGVVLLEMLTGRRTFRGDHVTDVLAAVLTSEPDWARLPAGTPSSVRRLLRRCLEKDPRKRLSAIGDARLELDDASIAPSVDGGASAAMSASHLNRAALALVLLLVAGLTAATTWVLTRSTPTAVQPVRFVVVPPTDATLATGRFGRDIAISPDGTRIVYRTGADTTAELQVRPIDQTDAVPLRGIGGAHQPFFSPDSHSVGFFTQSAMDARFRTQYDLKSVPASGGPARTICQLTSVPLGGSWGDGDAIVFATDDASTGLLRVSGDGGTPTVLTRPDPEKGEADHVLPFVLPGGQLVLFTIVMVVPTGTLVADHQIAVLDLTTGQHHSLFLGGSHAEFVASAPGSGQPGYLVYASTGTLRAVRFDPARREVLGDHMPIAALSPKENGAADFSLSRTGTLVYVAAGAGMQGARRTLVWVDRKGREAPIKVPPRAYAIPRISPDGTRVALQIDDQDRDIWTWNIERQTLARLTLDPAVDRQPVWTPDSQRIIFSSERTGPGNLFWHAADGTGGDERLTTSENYQYPTSITPDGTILVHEHQPKSNWDIVGVPLRAGEAKRRSELLIQTEFPEYDAQISPNGRYIAYLSTESERAEIYVRSYPSLDGGRWLVSAAGGSRPAWARSGRELFYLDSSSALMVVPALTSGATFTFGHSTKVFDTKYATPSNVRSYDVSADGQRFLMIKELPNDKAIPAGIVVVLHWLDELKARR